MQTLHALEKPFQAVLHAGPPAVAQFLLAYEAVQ